MERTLPILWPLTRLPNYKVLDGWMFHNWRKFHVKSASYASCVLSLLNFQADSLSLKPPEIWSTWGLQHLHGDLKWIRSHVSAGDLKIRLTRSRISWHRGKLLPPKISDKVNFFKFLLSSLADHTLPKSYTMKIFMTIFTCLWLGNMSLFMYLRPLYGIEWRRKVIQLPEEFWICYDFIVPSIKKNYPWFPMPQFPWKKFISSVMWGFLSPLSTFPISLINFHKPRETFIQTLYREMYIRHR